MADMKIWYDCEGDYLEVMFEDSPAVTEEIADAQFERRAPDYRMIGFVDFNFSKRDRDSLTLPLVVTAVASN